jgi:hypothetical protein
LDTRRVDKRLLVHGPEPRFLLALLGDVSSTLREHSLRLRHGTSVTRVDRQCDILGGGQPSIEWHVDAELASSDAVSWRLMLYWSGDTWVVEADARRVRAGRSVVEAEVAPRSTDDEGLGDALRAVAAELVTTMPQDG